MTSASREMESGAALRASVISASRSIRYWSSGAMLGYGVLGSWACVCHDAPSKTTSAKVDQNPDPLGWQAEGEEEWREHDERAARDARDGEGEEDRGEGDRGQAAEVQRDAVEPADEERADGPRHRRGDLER